jgi:hypothetical protein
VHDGKHAHCDCESDLENLISQTEASVYVSTRRGGSCDGEFPVQGTYKDNKLDVRTIEKVGKASDCIFRLRMNVQGNKLVGNMGKTELTLSK